MRLLRKLGGGSGAPTAKAANVTGTGAVHKLARLLGATSTISLLSSNPNLSLSDATISAANALAPGASQTAIVREKLGDLAVEYPYRFGTR